MPKGTPGRLICSVGGCDNYVASLDLCAKHRLRVKRTGSVDLRGRPSTSERFWRQVDKAGGCWLWAGRSFSQGGYGIFALSHSDRVGAHRFAYTDVVGPIPEGLTIDHLCRVPACVRPDHLEPVTQRENTLRGTSPAAGNAAKTECKRGHPLSGENLFVNSRGERQCRECDQRRRKIYYQRRRNAAAS